MIDEKALYGLLHVMEAGFERVRDLAGGREIIDECFASGAIYALNGIRDFIDTLTGTVREYQEDDTEEEEDDTEEEEG